jgi:peptidoglycan/LPS O-acetylase OafA/YrhL
LPTEPSLSDSAAVGPPADDTMRKAAKKGSAFYRPELDVLRFFAFFCVFLTHGVRVNLKGGILAHHPALGKAIASLDAAGSYGLPLFFCLSSFLITTLLLIEKGKTGRVALRSFYIRRILRIWPLYFGFLTLMFILGCFWKPGYISVRALLAFFLLSGNWYVIVAGYLADTMTFLWSISVEEQFYLVWPTLVRNLTPRGIQRFCIGLVIVSLCATAALAATHSSVINLWYNSASQMLFFAGGGLLAIRIGLIRQQKSAWKTGGALLTGAACWFIANTVKGYLQTYDLIPPFHALASYLFICLGCAAFLWGFLHMPNAWLRPKIVYLGRISYGLYVFQGIGLIVGGRFFEHYLKGGTWLVVSLAVIIALATLSYEFCEKPFLKLKHRFELVHSRPV